MPDTGCFPAIQVEHPHRGPVSSGSHQARVLQHGVHAFSRVDKHPKRARLNRCQKFSSVTDPVTPWLLAKETSRLSRSGAQ
jgi:hypothetical protein